MENKPNQTGRLEILGMVASWVDPQQEIPNPPCHHWVTVLLFTRHLDDQHCLLLLLDDEMLENVAYVLFLYTAFEIPSNAEGAQVE
jgi:hypothetical protein